MRPLALLCLLVGCAPEAPDALVVFAAASATDAASDLGRAFEAETGAPVTISTGATSTLAHQIAAGAPADAMLFAGTEWADWLEARGTIQAPVVVARGALVVVVPSDAPAWRGIEPLADAPRVAMADPSHVPAGQFAREALERAGLWRTVESRVVPFPDVRAALGAVASRKVDAGIVYASDAGSTPRVRVAARIPDSHSASHRVRVRGGREPPEAGVGSGVLPERVAAFRPLAPSRISSGIVSAADWAAVALSLRVALAATALALIPGVALGWALARQKLRAAFLWEYGAMLPLVLPPVVTGYALLLALPRSVAFTWIAGVLASAIVGFPLLVQTARVAFEVGDSELDDAARADGASGWQVFRRVTLPLAGPGVAAGAALHFARALGEFGATVVVAGNIPLRTQTLPLALYARLNQAGGEAPALMLAGVAVALSAACLGLYAILISRLRAL